FTLASVGERIATLLPPKGCSCRHLLQKMRFPGSCNPGNIHHQVSRRQDVFERLTLLVCEFARSNSEARPIGSQTSRPPRTRFRSCSSSSFACSVVTCESSSCMNRSLLTYSSTS